MLLQGLIQSVFELHDGSGVVVTIGKYVTPKFIDINSNGIEPDYRNFPSKDHHNVFFTDIKWTIFDRKNVLYAAWNDVINHLL